MGKEPHKYELELSYDSEVSPPLSWSLFRIDDLLKHQIAVGAALNKEAAIRDARAAINKERNHVTWRETIEVDPDAT